MKKVDIEEIVTDGFTTVDLKIDDQVIKTGDDIFSSFSFWQKMEEATQRALYRIKTKNPKYGFDFNLATMALSEEEKAKRFTDYAKKQRPDVDVDKVFDLFEKEVAKLQKTGPDDNHPNPYMKSPINSDLVKIIFINVLGNYNKKEE